MLARVSVHTFSRKTAQRYSGPRAVREHRGVVTKGMDRVAPQGTLNNPGPDTSNGPARDEKLPTRVIQANACNLTKEEYDTYCARLFSGFDEAQPRVSSAGTEDTE